MTVHRRIFTALILSLAFLAGLIAFAPATVLNFPLQTASGGMLSLVQTQGSVWQGSGVALLRHSSGHLLLGHYRWTFQPWHIALLLYGEKDLPAVIRLHPLERRLDIENLHVRLPAGVFELLSPLLRTYQFRGTLSLHAAQLSLDASGVEGQMVLEWQEAYSGLSPIRPLGNYRIVLHGRKEKINIQLTTVSGRLILEANGDYDAGRGLQISGTARASPEAAEALDELLHHIGPETAPGVFSFALMPTSRDTQ